MSRYDGRLRDDGATSAFNGAEDAMSRIGTARLARGSLEATDLDPQLLRLPIVSLMSWLSMQPACEPIDEAAVAQPGSNALATCSGDVVAPPTLQAEPEILHAPYRVPVSFHVLPSTALWNKPAEPAQNPPERRAKRRPVAYRLATRRLRAMQNEAVPDAEDPGEIPSAAVADAAAFRELIDLVASKKAEMTPPTAVSLEPADDDCEIATEPVAETKEDGPCPGQASLLLATDRASWLLSLQLQRRGGPD